MHSKTSLEPPTEAAAQLKGFIRHRYELVRESTRRKNKLISICDELFPEFTRVLKDPTLPTALALRERFPTPHAIATTSLSALREVRVKHFPSEAQLYQLQQLASESIGTKDLLRQRGLVLEQSQLIRELKLIREHIEQLEREIKAIVEQAREGKILTSMGIGAIQAATIIAAIGSIHNFPSAATLKPYFGWAPIRTQTGITLNHSALTCGGTRTMKQIMFLIVAHATQRRESEWAKLYERLVKAKCPYDERTASYKGKVRVMGRIAGQMIEVFTEERC